MTVFLTSFGFKYGPAEARMVLDVRCLENPYWVPELRELTGRDPAVQEYIKNNPDSRTYLRLLEDLLLLQLQLEAGRGTEFSVAVGCTGGRHRSVAVCEHLARKLRQAGHTVCLAHRQL